MQTTRPAAPSFESQAPEAARLTELAKLALEANVSVDDVRAYVTGRYAVRQLLIETTGISL